ncbi:MULTISPECIES: hypothetical protein [unclassified Caballeronia]|uniref:hypothetical protein n=1 Tax=unclassified Caballeronia TaxID=2646786 RepID=UPI0028587B45|nr:MULTISPECIES: hypothetical protein [unclassified Caballeronia]MDR5755015.1 hypothetical protein [Caballeronia sp. LZ024]MDR5845577.1 hypothetical protein [Caballeronia sp. LZ031]
MKHVFRSVVVAAALSATLSTFPQPAAAACANGIQTGASAAPVTFIVDGASGGTLCLTYVVNDGWRLDASDDGPDAATGQLTPVARGAQDRRRHPPTVFIDGATGYTYTWFQNEGWQFVGRIAERAP